MTVKSIELTRYFILLFGVILLRMIKSNDGLLCEASGPAFSLSIFKIGVPIILLTSAFMRS